MKEKNLLRRFFIIARGNEPFKRINHLNISRILKPVIFVIQPVNTVFDLAGMISACLPDASVLPTAVNGVTLIPALSVTVWGIFRKPSLPAFAGGTAVSATSSDSFIHCGTCRLI
jgi:hypothetical protein